MKCPHCKQEYDIKFLYEKKKCKNCGTPANLTVGQNNDVARLYSAITDNASVPQKKKCIYKDRQKFLCPATDDEIDAKHSTVSSSGSFFCSAFF